MRYYDAIYGPIQLPNFLSELLYTGLLVRLRGISLSVVPNILTPHVLSNRCQHSVQVAHHGLSVIENNPELVDWQYILPAAALLHDAGSPTFSHLSEHFLRELTGGKNGEAFLSDMLELFPDTVRVLKRYHIPQDQIVALVTGNQKPLSDVLHGSMDIDNLSNVMLFFLAVHANLPSFNAHSIAKQFRFHEKLGWTLPAKVIPQVKFWQQARLSVYNAIYSEPQLNVATMLYRAVELMFCDTRRKLTLDFFILNDLEAIEYLETRGNKAAKRLVAAARQWRWYAEVVSIQTTAPNGRFKELAANWRGRAFVANEIAKRLGLGPEQVCAYVGKGNERRAINIGFIQGDEIVPFDNRAIEPMYRAKIYLPERLRDKKDAVATVLQELLNE